jgi:serine phosphatase RsbU (regulator of sigma subunit)/ligand-binding sensor domain-containing protein
LLAARPAGAGETGVPYFTNHDPRAANEDIGYQNWAIAQDSRGVMYFGNTAGVVEYDGVDWRIIPVAGTARSLAADADGRIWVGVQGDLGYLEPGGLGEIRFRSLLEAVPSRDRSFTDVWKTHASPEGIYFQTFSHLFLWDGRSMRVWRPATQFHMSFLVGEHLYIREDGRGVLEMRNGRLELPPWGGEFAHDRIYVMLPAGDGAILVGSRERGLFLVEGGAVRPFHTEADAYLAANQLYHGTLLADSTFALATLRGGAVLIDRDGRLLHILDRSLGIQDSAVTCVATDDRGGLWMALDRNLARVQIPASFTVFGEVTGLVGAVQSVLRHDGRLIVATTQGVYRLERSRGTLDRPGTVDTFVPIAGIATQSWHLVEVGGRVLVATNDGVFEIVGRQAKPAVELLALALEPSVESPGRAYVGLLDGVAVIEASGTGWRMVGRIPAIDDEVRSLLEDGDALWSGGRYHGVAQVELAGASPSDWRVHEYREGEGLPLGVGRPRLARVGGGLLIASRTGLLRYDQDLGSFEPTTEFGLHVLPPGAWVTQVREGAHGDVWMVTEGGVGVARRSGPDQWRWDDAPFRQLSPRGVWVVAPEAGRAAWFGTSDGLIRYDPSVRQPAPPAFRALVRSVRSLIDEKLVYRGTAPPGGEAPRATLPYRQNSLRFEYAAPAPGAESAVEYRVLLDGFDPRWSAWTREVKREYTNLREGAYTFRVQARMPGAIVSETGDWSFVVEPPWYRTAWAWIAYALATALILFAVMRLLVARARHVERREAEDRRRQYELQRARRIQRNMLPSEPPDLPWLELAAVQHTATEVGGDYYDFFPQADGRLYVVCGDATGHGLGAGLMVTATRTALLTMHDADLVAVVDKMNQVLRRVNLGARLNMALTLVALSPPRSDGSIVVEASGGGMAPMYVLRVDGSVEEVLVPGVPLGALVDSVYALVDLELTPGDILVMMSDGVPEHYHPERGPLGYDGVQRALADFGRWYASRMTEVSAQEVLDFVLETCNGWSPRETLADDVTLVVAKVRKTPGVRNDRDSNDILHAPPTRPR